ncbi:MAG: hypothetical protein R3E91_04655 [Chlamydiales bacterium]
MQKQSVISTPFFVTNALQDQFLHAGKSQPSMYLDPAIRAGISSFARPGFEGEVSEGLEALKRDIETKKIDHIIQQYESNCGDYLYISALKDHDVVSR